MLNVPTVVKDTLKSGMYQKNHRIVVLDAENTELFTIDNNSLVDGSVFYDERLCTGDVLKFGLCEGSSLQFQYFNHESILGKKLQCFIDVQYKDADGSLKWFEIPMGFYDVAQCPMQFDTGIRKVTAYNKLKSEYLDADATEEIKEIMSKGQAGSSKEVAIISILDQLLDGFSISYAPDISLDSSFYPNIRVYTLSVFTEFEDANAKIKTGKYLKQLILAGNLGEILNSTDFYRIIAKAKLINDFVEKLENGHTDKYYYRDSDTPSRAFPWSYWKDTWGARIDVTLKDGSVISSKELGKYDELYVSEWLTNVGAGRSITVRIPIYYEYNNSKNIDVKYREYAESNLFQMLEEIPDCISLFKRNLTDIEKMRLKTEDINENVKVTLRELQSSTYEMNCQFGQLDRTTDLFSGINLNNERLFPAETLFPDNGLYPNGNAEHVNRSSYEKLWTDSQGVQKFKDLIITYKALKPDGNEEEQTLTRTVNSDGTQNYNMSSNWLFKNLVWTAEQVAEYADAMVEKMRNVTWFPFEMWCAGLPYIEVGDELEIATPEGTYTSYILTRSLKGIQDMHDTYINGTLDIF